jgi:hypothetical protein
MENGVRSGRKLPIEYLTADPRYKGADKLKIKLMNDLQDRLIRMVANYPYPVAEDVYDTVFIQAIKVPYTDVNTEEVEKLKTKFMNQAREKLTESEANFMRMQKDAADSAERRRQTKAKLADINSPRKQPASACPGCSIQGGRSYKYRNMRKSSRNMRKSRRKSRK